ncbi:Asp-tRNA(Asn)/Glu-tRNA(Gln) amidotransferase GatCAB subunit C [Candidatus Woesearchaeota archaeon]|jgi:aspartyl-tRNA(Asn)/glutamyl-tRNA(Gln) amidotransferase subunit C|nr:Asp-tRNA(Asn)/Glu-tRNA(Gln) amidotransferase GatCAB subunit C [Candidatus Woesearchaeota archaeon]|tara:strand:- start:1044 stop:1322 length:279 start_codon:yes stop_codon:yes gene_type:complete
MITQDVLDKVAKNARLSLTKEEAAQFLPQLDEVLTHFSTLKDVDTEGVEPSFLPVKLTTEMREDEPEECLTQEEALKNAQSKNGYIKGPKSV